MQRELYHVQSLKLLPKPWVRLTRKQEQAIGARLLLRELRYDNAKSIKAFVTITIRLQTYF